STTERLPDVRSTPRGDGRRADAGRARGDGGRRGGARRPGRARRLTGPRFKRAATAEEGPGRAASPGCGASRGRGSSGQRRRGKGRGRAFRPGAASRGVGAQASSDGRGRGGAEPPTQARRLLRPGFKRAATAGAGPGWRSSFGSALPAGGARVLYVGFSGGVGRPARLGVGLDYVYPRVVARGGA